MPFAQLLAGHETNNVRKTPLTLLRWSNARPVAPLYIVVDRLMEIRLNSWSCAHFFPP